MTSSRITDTELARTTVHQVGLYASIAVAVLTLVTFGFAIIAVPISGANCLEGCIDYPYLDTVAQFPKDYRWMPLAGLLMLAYIIWTFAIQATIAPRKKVHGQIGLAFASMAALVLITDYFVQFSVVPISLMSNETEGITLLTQYNAHGIFIALEELGYLLMALSFAFMALALDNHSRLETAARWVFTGGFGLAVVAFVTFSVLYSLDRQDRFEVAVISIDWLVLLVNGILISVWFRNQQRAKSQ